MRIYKFALATLIGLLVVVLAVPAGADSSRQRRDAARAKRAQLAAELNALKASDTQLESAVRALDTQVQAQSAAASAARQSVAAAEQTLAQAEAKVKQTELEITTLRDAVVKRAVDAYVSPHGESLGLSNARDITEATRRNALLSQIASHDRDVIDKLKAAKEDFALQQAEAAKARDLAAGRRRAVEARLGELKKARAEKQRLESALSTRIAEFQGEVDALSREEANLSNLIRQREAAARASRGGASVGDGRVSGMGLIWPVRGSVTSEYGYRWGRMHQGLDIGAGTGTPIHAAKAGEVMFSGTMSGYGNVVIVDHGGGFSTLYAHQSRIASSEGQRVSQGQTIGYVGSTGRSTGPHLHFETRVNGSAQNPRRYLP